LGSGNGRNRFAAKDDCPNGLDDPLSKIPSILDCIDLTNVLIEPELRLASTFLGPHRSGFVGSS
jgi:hypothetical protein